MLFYKGTDKFLIAVDSIILGFDGKNLNLLLFKRIVPPAKGEWSLMGGFLKKKESLDDAAERVLFKLTGLRDIYLEQLYTYGKVDRDPGYRVISVAYFALIKIDDYLEQLNHQYHAHWFPITEFPELIFDHNIMVNKALRRLRRKAQNQPIGFELLPKKFTIPQLQRLYEAIFDKKFDKRNFRKKILSLHVLKKFDEKEKTGSRKGAFLHEFDQDKYKILLENGFNFEVNI